MSIDPSIPDFTGTVTCLTDTPLVASGMFAPAALAGLEPDALANINGPSVLRMTDWAAGKQAAFQMYFGHHKGKSLRLAYGNRLKRPRRCIQTRSSRWRAVCSSPKTQRQTRR